MMKTFKKVRPALIWAIAIAAIGPAFNNCVGKFDADPASHAEDFETDDSRPPVVVDLPGEMSQRLAISSPEVWPGETAIFKLRLDAPLPADLSFSYEVLGQTAVESQDFIPAQGTGLIAKGELETTILVPTLNFRRTLGKKAFDLKLTGTLNNANFAATVVGEIKELRTTVPRFSQLVGGGLSGSFEFTCGLTLEEKIGCWGISVFFDHPNLTQPSQLIDPGNPSYRTYETPTPPKQLLSFVTTNFVLAYIFICYVDAKKDLYCRGTGTDGKFKKVSLVNAAESFDSVTAFGVCYTPVGGNTVVCDDVISRGSRFWYELGPPVRNLNRSRIPLANLAPQCSLDTQGVASCIAGTSPTFGGNQSAIFSTRFVDDSDLSDTKKIVQGSRRTCLLKNDGSLRCSQSPVEDPDNSMKFKDITIGRSFHACGITLDNKIYCWGRYESGVYHGPQLISENHTPIALVAPHYWLEPHGEVFCFLDADGVTYCFGDDKIVSRASPNSEKTVQIGYFGNSICELTDSKKIFCSVPFSSSSSSSNFVLQEHRYVQFAATKHDDEGVAICAIDENGSLYCGSSSELSLISGYGKFRSIKSSLTHICAENDRDQIICIDRSPAKNFNDNSTVVYQATGLESFWVGSTFLAYRTNFQTLRWNGFFNLQPQASARIDLQD